MRKLIAVGLFLVGFGAIVRQGLGVIPEVLAEGAMGASLIGLVIYYMILTLLLGAICAGLGWAPAVPNHPDPKRNGPADGTGAIG